jgi:hypothetical protein
MASKQTGRMVVHRNPSRNRSTIPFEHPPLKNRYTHGPTADRSMPLWLIIAVSAIGGGIVFLHGFRKSKDSCELMLETYQGMLKQSLEIEEKKKKEKADAEEDENEETDQPA